MYRKHLSFILKLVVLVMVTSALVGCGGSSNYQNPSSSTAQPTPPLTQSQRAEVTAVTEWFAELNKTQTESIGGLAPATTTLTVKTISVGKVNGHPMTAEDLVRGLVHADANLIDITFAWHTTDTIVSVQDSTGEAEAEGIGVTVSDTQNLSESDVANGITFQGTIEIKFISRYRTQSSAPYTKWVDDGSSFGVIIQNGTPTVHPGFLLIKDPIVYPMIVYPMVAVGQATFCKQYGLSDGC
jgi:hypothetical protein